jgi:hypothetical protein
VIQIERLRLQPPEEVVAVAIILVEEQTRGRLAAIGPERQARCSRQRKPAIPTCQARLAHIP